VSRSRSWSRYWPRLETFAKSLGLGLETFASLGLGLEAFAKSLGVGLETSAKSLGLGLETFFKVSITRLHIIS
jgi:hypothetical protein